MEDVQEKEEKRQEALGKRLLSYAVVFMVLYAVSSGAVFISAGVIFVGALMRGDAVVALYSSVAFMLAAAIWLRIMLDSLKKNN